MSLETFLLGSSNANADPLTISTGIGDGQAQVLKPYSGDAWRQAIQLNQEQDRIDLQRQKQEAAANNEKSDRLKSLNKIGGYRPQEFKNITARRDKLVNQILILDENDPKYPEKLAEIESGIGSLSEIVTASKDVKSTYEKANELAQSGKFYIAPETLDQLKKDYEEDYGVIDDDVALIDKLASKSSGAISLKGVEPLIKDENSFLTGIAKSASMGEPEIVTLPDANGQKVTKVVTFTDPAKLDALGRDAWANNVQMQKKYPDIEDFLTQLNNRAVLKNQVSSKYEPSYNNGNVSGGGTVTTGKMVLSPVQEMVYTDVESQDRAYKKYKDAFMKLIADESDDKKFLALYQAMLSPEAYKKAHPYSEKIEVIPLSTIGLAENSPHKFNVTIDGVETEVFGQPIKYAVTKDAFIIQPDKDSPKTYLAKVSKNPQYLTDSDQTIDDFRKAVKKVKGGNYVTTGKGGDVVSTKKVKAKAAAPANSELRKTKDGRRAYFDKKTKKFISWE